MTATAKNLLSIGIICSILGAGTTLSAPKFTFNAGKSTCEITQSFQLWGVYTMSSGNIPHTDSRADLFLRQGRIGFKGKVLPGLSYSTQFAFDNIGKDQFTGTVGAPQASTNATVQLYDLYVQYAPDSTYAIITFGYMRPQTGHESIAPDAGVNSFEKALTNIYLRTFETGRSNGRETGMNIGGFMALKSFAIAYNAGIFDINHVQITGTDLGSRKWHPLCTGRLALSFGDADMETYKLSPEINQFGARKGITIGGHAAYQGATDETWDTSAVKYDTTRKEYSGAPRYTGGIGVSNATFGADFVFNFAGLTIDGEYDLMRRELNGIRFHSDSVRAPAVTFRDRVYHIRAGYLIAIADTQFVEPSVMFSQFYGDKKSVLYPNGEDRIIDAGINWYINRNSIKLSLHYIRQSGIPKSLFQQAAPAKNGTVTMRGDMAILGFQLQL